MKQEHISRFVCPKCGKEFQQSPEDRFGPSSYKCGNCGEILATGLTEWAKLSLKDKVIRGTLEVVNPFNTGNLIYFILYHGVFFFIIIIPLGFLITGLKLQPGGLQPEELKKWKEVAPLIIGGIIYLVILFWRLIMRIIESQKYTNSGTPPTWTPLK